MATDSTKTKENRKLGITPTQVTASALAAITAAFLGSTLGVAGTVIGAGIASLVSTVGSAIYQRSLDRTGSTLRSRVSAFRGTPDTPEVVDSPVESSRTHPGFAGVLKFEDDSPTRQLRPASAAAPKAGRRRVRWPVVAGLAAVAFVLGMGVVTAVELLHGGPISGGNAGTSVGSLFGESTQHTTQSTTTVTPATTTTPATSTTTPTTTASPTTTPSASAVTSTPSTSAPTTTTVAPTTTAAPTTTP